MSEKRIFTFVWKDGKREEGQGDTVAEAFSSLGYGQGAVAALDYFEEKKQS